MTVLHMLLYMLSRVIRLDIWRWFQRAPFSLISTTNNQKLHDVLVSARYADKGWGLDACVANRVKTYLRTSNKNYINVGELCEDLRECTDDGILILRCKAGPTEFEMQHPDRIDLDELRDRVRSWNEISEKNIAWRGPSKPSCSSHPVPADFCN
jgi:hypothetical protein